MAEMELTHLQSILEAKIDEIAQIKAKLTSQIQAISGVSETKAQLVAKAKQLFQYCKSIGQVIRSYKQMCGAVPNKLNDLARISLRQFQQQIMLRQKSYKDQIANLKTQLHKATLQNQSLNKKITELEQSSFPQRVTAATPVHDVSIDEFESRSPAIEYPAFRLGTASEEQPTYAVPHDVNGRYRFKIKQPGMCDILKTEPHVEDSALFNIVEKSFSHRKVIGKPTTKNFIKDFRNIVEVTTHCTKQDNADHVGSSTAANSHVTDKAATPDQYMKMAQNIDLQKKYSFQGLSNIQNQPAHFIELGGAMRKSVLGNNRIERKPSKQKIQVTQKQRPKELAAKDINVLPPRPLSKQKIHMTIKQQTRQSSVKKQKSSIDQKANTGRIQELLDKIDLYVGDRKTQQRYEGTKKDEIRCGRGRLEYINGLVYEGEFKDNMRHGYGALSLNGKRIYQGHWQRDKLSGKGTLTNLYLVNKKKINEQCLLRHSIFEGSFMSNLFQGQGTLLFSNGDRVSGQFSQGHLKGEYVFYSQQLSQRWVEWA